MSRKKLMLQLASLRKRLSDEFGIRDAPDYAEVLVADALKGYRLKNRIAKGYDVRTDSYGRIEVKCRQLPTDGRVEERVEIGAGKEEGFDFLAIVIFMPDFSIKGAVIVPYSEVWEFVTQKLYTRISYSQACNLSGAIDISAVVQDSAEQ